MSRAAGRFAGLLLCTSAASASLSGRADEDPAPLLTHLAWVRTRGAEACIAPSDLAVSVGSRLRRRVFVTRARADVQVRGEIRPTSGGGFRVHIVLARADGTVVGVRDLETDTSPCDALDESIALVVAMAIDSPAARAAAKPSAPRVRARRWAATFDVGAALSAGLLAGWPPGIRGSGLVESPSFPPLLIELTTWGGTDRSVGGRGARLTGWHGGVGVCPLLRDGGVLDFHACLDVEAGQIHAVGFGFDQTYDASRAVVLVGAKGLLSLAWGRGGLRLTAGPAVPLLRDRFLFVNQDGSSELLHRVSSLTFLVALSAYLHVP